MTSSKGSRSKFSRTKSNMKSIMKSPDKKIKSVLN